MKRIVLCLMGALIVTGCDGEIDGTLGVQTQLQLVGKKGVTTLTRGSYEAEFGVEDDGREIELEVKDPRTGKELKVEMKVPAGTVPERNGSFSVLGANVGQHFNLAGSLNTQVDRSATHQDYESCSYTETVRVCQDVPVTDPRTGRVRYRRQCGNQYITRYGSKDVEFHMSTTTVRVGGQFTSPLNGALLGEFHGYRQDSQKVYTHNGTCR